MIGFLYKIPVINLLMNFISHILAALSVIAWSITIQLFSKLGLMNIERESFFPRSWCRFILWIYGIKIKVNGLENYDPNKGLILVTNHQSLFDIPAVWEACSGKIKMIAKKELFDLPFFGWAIKGVRFIKIDRGNKKSGQQAQADLNQRLRDGNQIWIAVEGTRSKTGELLPFKKGAFRIAQENKVPILPMVIQDALKVCPKGSLLVKGGRQIHVDILKEYKVEEFDKLHIEEMSQEVKSRMAESIKAFQSEKNSVK